MLVCVCGNVSDATIEVLAREGMGFEEILEFTHASSQCGICLEQLYEIYRSTVAEKQSEDYATIQDERQNISYWKEAKTHRENMQDVCLGNHDTNADSQCGVSRRGRDRSGR